jgi:hypothetical protein
MTLPVRTAKQWAAEKKQKKRKPAKKRKPVEWSEDQGKVREQVTSLSLESLLRQVEIAQVYLDELEARDLSEERLSEVTSATRLVTDGAKAAHQALAEIVPTSIIPEFNFALATGEDTCPCCKRPWPEDLPRDMSGFDEPPAEA